MELETLKQIYQKKAPQFDPDGFRLYDAAVELTGFDLYGTFPYEDNRGMFKEADGHQLMRYLTADRFGKIKWEIVPGTTYERAILGETDTTTPEYQAFETELYRAVLIRMGFEDILPQEHGEEILRKDEVIETEAITELKLYTHLHVEMVDAGHGGSTVFLESIGQDKKAAYTELVQAAIQTVQPLEDARCAFLQHTGGYPGVNEKIVSLLHTTEVVEGRLYGVTVCRSRGALSPEEITALKSKCREYFDAGWGSGFAHCPRQEFAGLYIHFERNSGDPLLTRAELDAALKAGRVSNEPMVSEVNKDTFWPLIQEARHLWGEDLDGSAQWLESQLLMMGPEQARNFDNIVHGYLDLSYKYGLWTAASVMLDGCSDDGFMDFRGWLIAQGRDVYLAALKDPDSLADVPLDGRACFESLAYIGDSAYEKLTGKHTYNEIDQAAYEGLKRELAQDIVYGEGIGYPYKWSEATDYLPRLCEKYLTPEALAFLAQHHDDTWNLNSPDVKQARETAPKGKKAKHRGGDAR